MKTLSRYFLSGAFFAILVFGNSTSSNASLNPLTTNPPFIANDDTDNDNDGWSVEAGDCDDSNPNINPGFGGQDYCDGLDNDCNQLVDEDHIAILNFPENCNDETGSISAIPMVTLGNETYSWSNGSTSPYLTDLESGTYTLTFSATGCYPLVIPVVVGNNTNVPFAAASISGPNSVCKGQTGVLFSVADDSNTDSWIWTLPAGATGSSTANYITVNFSSSYNGGNICVKGVNGCGQGADFCKNVSAIPIPAVPTAILGGSANACPNTTKTYSVASVPNATTYNWTAPSNASIVSGQGTTSVTVSFNANFTSGQIKVNAQNCSGTSNNRQMMVYGAPTSATGFTGPETGVCGGTTKNYSVAANASATSYTWTVPAGATFTGQGTNSISVTFPGAFTSGNISVICSSNCGTSTALTRTIRSVPVNPTSISGPSTVCPVANGIVYSTPAVAGATSYTWTLPQGCTIVNGANTNSITVNFSLFGGQVKVKANNACGSSGQISKSVSIVFCSAMVDEVIADEKIETESSSEMETTISEEGSKSQVMVFPNPNAGQFTISVDETGVYNLYNELGQTIQVLTFNQTNNHQIELNGIPSGLYFLVGTADTSTMRSKIVVR